MNATPNPNPNPNENPTPPAEQRPDLHLVPDPEPGEGPADTAGETAAEENTPGPVLDAEGNPVTAQAPLDVRIRDAVLHSVRGIPAFGQPVPSFRESIEYSAHADWATSDSGVKRALHGLATVLAFLVTYPLVDVLGRARTKPGPFAIAVLIVLAALSVLATT